MIKKLIAVGVFTYVLGLGYFYTCATFGTPIFDMRYAIWAKTIDIGLLWWIFFYLIIPKEYKNLFRWLLIFSGVRLTWEFISGITGIGVNNHWGVAACFLGLTIVLSVVLFKEFKKIQKYVCHNA